MNFDKSVVCPVLIGREYDLQLLDRLITQSKEGRGQIALISGEAGIGKSRLVREAKARAAHETLILEGYCFQTESVLPYARCSTSFGTFSLLIPASRSRAPWEQRQRISSNYSLN